MPLGIPGRPWLGCSNRTWRPTIRCSSCTPAYWHKGRAAACQFEQYEDLSSGCPIIQWRAHALDYVSRRIDCHSLDSCLFCVGVGRSAAADFSTLWRCTISAVTVNSGDLCEHRQQSQLATVALPGMASTISVKSLLMLQKLCRAEGQEQKKLEQSTFPGPIDF